MRSAVAPGIMAASKFNRFHFLAFWCFYAIAAGYVFAMNGVGLPWMMEE
ncbi:hypothetical protein [Peribacillus sp. FSL M8-0224]